MSTISPNGHHPKNIAAPNNPSAQVSDGVMDH